MHEGEGEELSTLGVRWGVGEMGGGLSIGCSGILPSILTSPSSSCLVSMFSTVLERGLALMSSIVLTWKYFLWLHSKSPPSNKHWNKR